MRKLRVGVAGPGRIAQGAHIPNYKKREDVEVVAVYSRSVERAKAAAEKFGIPAAFTDYQTMLESANLDAVSICVPNKYHAEMAVQALQSGCHVLCEKPPAVTAEEAIRMEEAAEKAGKVLSFNFHYRHSAEVKAIRSFIEAGELGTIYSARVHALRKRGIPGWGVFTDKELQGGGPLIDIGVHMLDTALYLMDYPDPSSVLAAVHQQIGHTASIGLMGNWDPAQFTVEDAAMGMIRFKDGQSLLLETSFALNMEKTEDMSVELFGNNGGAAVFPPRIYQEKHGQLVNTAFPHLKSQDMHERSVSDFVDSCLGMKEPIVQAHEGVALQRIIEAMYKSAESGEAVNFEENN